MVARVAQSTGPTLRAIGARISFQLQILELILAAMRQIVPCLWGFGLVTVVVNCHQSTRLCLTSFYLSSSIKTYDLKINTFTGISCIMILK